MKLPKQLIPDHEKNEDWAKKTIMAILSQQYHGESYSTFRKQDFDHYQLVDGKFNLKEYEYVTKTYGLTTPARLVNYPLILPKLNLIAGELMSQGLNFTTHVINREAVRKKNEAKIAVASEFLMRPIRRQMEKVLGTQLTDEELEQSVPDDIKEFSTKKFRHHMEEYVTIGVKDLIRRFELKHIFKRGFYDMGIVYKEAYHVTIKNGFPFPQRIDPRVLIYDANMDKEDIEKGKFAGTDNYFSLNDILDEHPDLPVEKVEELEKLEGQDQNYFAEVNRNGRFYFNEENSGLKIRVVKMQWRSLRKMRYKLSENPYDPENPYVKLLKEDYKPKKNDRIETRVIDDLWECSLIGHDMVHGLRRSPNQIRFEENYAKAELDYVGVKPNQFTGLATSLVGSLKNIQILYNITMYSIQLAMARAGGKAVVYDVSQKPKKMSTADVMHHAKNSGLIFINSKQEGNQLNTFNQWTQVDFTMSNTVDQLLRLKIMLEDLADKVSGITAARAGIVSSGDLVGVNEQSQLQSSLITLPLFDSHYKAISKVLNKVAGKMKFCLPHKKWMANLFGDGGMEIVKMDKSLGMDEYSIYLENSGKDIQDKRDMIQLLGQAVAANNGTADLTMMAKALRSDSASQVEDIINKGVTAANEVLQANEERKMQLQEESNRLLEQKMGLDIEKANIQSKTDIRVAEIQANAKLADTERKLEHDADKLTATNEHDLDMQMLMDANTNIRERNNSAKEAPTNNK